MSSKMKPTRITLALVLLIALPIAAPIRVNAIDSPRIAVSEKDKSTLSVNEGDTAEYALKAAKESGYSYSFFDSHNVDVTKSVEQADQGAQVLTSKVTKVETSRGFLFFGPSVRFTLDYTDTEAEKERKDKEASKAAKQEKLASDREAAEACKGKAAREAYAVMKETNFDFKIVDSAGADVTDDIASELTKELAEAGVKSVDIKKPGWFSDKERATLTLDYKRPTDVELINSCKGKTAAEALAITKKLGYTDPRFEYMVFEQSSFYGWDNTTDYTEEAFSERYSGAMRRVSVTEVDDYAVREKKKDGVLRFTIDRPLAIAPEDNEVLAQILSNPSPDKELIDAFNDEFRDVLIEFDGCVISCERASGIGYYDYEIRCGDYPGDSNCPTMICSGTGDVGKEVYGTSSLVPEQDKAVGCNVHFYAQAKAFYSDEMFLKLRPYYAILR